MDPDRVAAHAFLRDLPPDDLEAVARAASPREFAAGERLTSQGDFGHRLFLVEAAPATPSARSLSWPRGAGPLRSSPRRRWRPSRSSSAICGHSIAKRPPRPSDSAPLSTSAGARARTPSRPTTPDPARHLGRRRRRTRRLPSAGRGR